MYGWKKRGLIKYHNDLQVSELDWLRVARSSSCAYVCMCRQREFARTCVYMCARARKKSSERESERKSESVRARKGERESEKARECVRESAYTCSTCTDQNTAKGRVAQTYNAGMPGTVC